MYQVYPSTYSNYDRRQKERAGTEQYLYSNIGLPSYSWSYWDLLASASANHHHYPEFGPYARRFCNRPAPLGLSVTNVPSQFEKASVPMMDAVSAPLCFDNAGHIPTPLGWSCPAPLSNALHEDLCQTHVSDYPMPYEQQNGFVDVSAYVPARIGGSGEFGHMDVPPITGSSDFPPTGLPILVDSVVPDQRSDMNSIAQMIGFRPVGLSPTRQSSEQQLHFGVPVSDIPLHMDNIGFNATDINDQWVRASIEVASFGTCDAPTPRKNRAKTVPKQQHASTRGVRKSGLGASSSRSKYNKRERSLSPEGRKNAAAVRRRGSCVRCRMFKLKCDGNNPCLRCDRLFNPRTWSVPCKRLKLRSIHIVRHGFGRFDQHNVKFIQYGWADARCNPDMLSLEWFLPGDRKIVAKQRLVLPVRRYVADTLQSDPDTFNYHWNSNGEEVCIRVPPFACEDDETVSLEITPLLKNSELAVEAWLTDHHKHDKIAQIIHAEAKRLCKEHKSKVIAAALDLQRDTIVSQGVGSVLAESFPLLLQDEGCDDIRKCTAFDGEASGQERPIPMAVQHQIEVAILLGMQKKQKKLLRDLDELFRQAKPRPWYEIFLTFFILLKNMEWLYSGALGYKQRCEETVLASQVNGVIQQMVKEYKCAATVMLYHFQCILHGDLPFQLVRNNPTTLQTDLNIDRQQLEFLQTLVRLLDEKHMRDPCPSGDSICSAECAPDGHWICKLFNTCSRKE